MNNIWYILKFTGMKSLNNVISSSFSTTSMIAAVLIDFIYFWLYVWCAVRDTMIKNKKETLAIIHFNQYQDTNIKHWNITELKKF